MLPANIIAILWQNCGHFLGTYENYASRIDLAIAETSSRTFQQNREVLRSVLKCLEFSERQGIALRGHRDDNAQFCNIHFICTSNHVPVMEMARPLVDQLLELERGIVVFDAQLNTKLAPALIKVTSKHCLLFELMLVTKSLSSI